MYRPVIVLYACRFNICFVRYNISSKFTHIRMEIRFTLVSVVFKRDIVRIVVLATMCGYHIIIVPTLVAYKLYDVCVFLFVYLFDPRNTGCVTTAGTKRGTS